MNKKHLLIIICSVIVLIFVLIQLDKLNIITNLGLSVDFWSGMVAGTFPIFLTLFLWRIEQKERIQQIKDETKLQKQLIVRSNYIDYFESLLEQLNELSIFLESFILKDNNKKNDYERAEELIKACYAYYDKKIWLINYKKYPFKAVDIDISNYNYGDNIINLRAYNPYIMLKNNLEAIYNQEEMVPSINGVFRKKLNQTDMIKKAKMIINNRKQIEELNDCILYLKEDIENRIL